ncbi:IS21 family transposase [Mycobacterium paragordonae]|uniref:IS21 family transposase n=1 Tax=Mycobacterium paragordonae TaxID=1389713 RepID=UPI00105CFE43|nr:IS21 family transposase [Mycobacterium paragordonae]TDK86603.1 IS21 family transposase [Mycobacterium paragordonae]
MLDLVELFTHWHAGRSQVQLSDSLKIDRKTIRKYLAPAIAAGIEPGGPPLSAESWAELIEGWFPELNDPGLRAHTWPLIAAYRDQIKVWLDADVTVATIAQRLRDDHQLAASESSVRRWIATHFAEEAAREKVTVPRGPVDPGSEAQIDYGKLGMWFDPSTGRRVAVWAFVMVLACSRHLFVRPVIRMDQTTWCACHVAAFEYFGGVPARLVCDNLKTGVDKPDLYDPQINRSYAELAVHYGTLVDPARAFKPKDKPRVERPMSYVRDSFWKGRDFTSLAVMQVDAARWSTEVAGGRHCRALEGAAPVRVFEAVEADALIALPRTAFELTTWSVGTVGVDAHLKVGKALYSVPWRLIGQRLHARTAGDVVQIFTGADVVATHLRRPSGRSTDFSHYPPEKIAFHMKTPAWCRRTAELIGPACEQVITDFMADNAIHHLRSAQGVLGLRDKHGCERLEAACARAIAAGDPSYRTIKGILIAGTEQSADAPVGGGAAAATGAYLRGPEQFDTPVARSTHSPIATS